MLAGARRGGSCDSLLRLLVLRLLVVGRAVRAAWLVDNVSVWRGGEGNAGVGRGCVACRRGRRAGWLGRWVQVGLRWGLGGACRAGARHLLGMCLGLPVVS